MKKTRDEMIEELVMYVYENEADLEDESGEEGLSFNTWSFGADEIIDKFNSMSDQELLVNYQDKLGQEIDGVGEDL